MLKDNNLVFPVYIYNRIIEKVIDLCKKFTKEIFGYLIGNILKWNNNLYIIIEDQLFIDNTINGNQFSTSQIEGTAGEFDKELREIKKSINDENLLVVGWWHSHIDLGCFLSPTDINTQETFFPESYQIAMVLDAIREEYKFFTLDKNSNKKYKSVSNAIISSD